jgi:AraC-like DNA-binding protein
MDSGYRSLTTFNRAFKASFGLTPREYREKH